MLKGVYILIIPPTLQPTYQTPWLRCRETANEQREPQVLHFLKKINIQPPREVYPEAAISDFRLTVFKLSSKLLLKGNLSDKKAWLNNQITVVPFSEQLPEQEFFRKTSM